MYAVRTKTANKSEPNSELNMAHVFSVKLWTHVNSSLCVLFSICKVLQKEPLWIWQIREQVYALCGHFTLCKLNLELKLEASLAFRLVRGPTDQRTLYKRDASTSPCPMRPAVSAKVSKSRSSYSRASCYMINEEEKRRRKRNFLKNEKSVTNFHLINVAMATLLS